MGNKVYIKKWKRSMRGGKNCCNVLYRVFIYLLPVNTILQFCNHLTYNFNSHITSLFSEPMRLVQHKMLDH